MIEIVNNECGVVFVGYVSCRKSAASPFTYIWNRRGSRRRMRSTTEVRPQHISQFVAVFFCENLGGGGCCTARCTSIPCAILMGDE